MKIPITIETEKDLSALSQTSKDKFDISDDPEKFNALTDSDFYTYLKEHLDRVVETGKETHRFINVINKVDDLLEKNISEYRVLVCDTENSLISHASDIERIHNNLETMLRSLLSLLCTKTHISRFKSMERLLQIIPLSLDFNIIMKCLDIIFVKFTLEQLSEGDYQYFEKDLPRLCYQVAYLFQHHNLNSFYSLSLQDLFMDDLKYAEFVESVEGQSGRKEMMGKYKDELVFEYVGKKIGANTKESDVIRINVEDLKEKYPGDSHYVITRKIISEYNISVEENKPLFDKLLFKVRTCKGFSEFKHRALVASTSIDSLRLMSKNKIFRS